MRAYMQGNVAKQLSKSKKYLDESVFENKIKFSDTHIILISKYIDDNITTIMPLPGRKLSVSIKDSFDFKIKPNIGEIDKGFKEILYYPFYIQTILSAYLLVASKYNIYDTLDREPYHESIGEFRYQAQLAKALGLKHAIAYNCSGIQLPLQENKVLDEDLELMYCGDKKLSFLIYSL